MTEKLFKYLKGDRTIWVIAILLSIISLLAVYSSISSLAHKYHDGNTLYYLFKHFIMLSTGFVIMYYVHRMPHRYFYRLSQLMFWVAAVLLVFTLMFGANINSASRWLTIPIINQNFQTSDLAKIVLVAYLARMLTNNKEQIREFKGGVLMILLPVFLICGLILPANFSTAALLFFTCLVIMFTGGVRVVHLFGIVSAGIIGFGMLLLVEKSFPGTLPRLSTWESRIESYLGTGESDKSEASLQENYQSQMAKIAIYNGGFAPSLPGKAASRNYMPHPYSDMIYAFIVEEYGSILGGVGLIVLYLILFFRVIKIALASDKQFNRLLVLGLGFMMLFQAMVNMAVAVNLFPVTGQPLPMVSMGGTSVWFTCIALGMILSISRQQSESGEKVSKKTKGAKLRSQTAANLA